MRYVYATSGLLALLLIALIIAVGIGAFSYEKLTCTPEKMSTHALCGAIDRESVSQAVIAIENGAKTLYISSDGGEFLQMHELLKAVEANNVEVIAFNECLSSCFILIAATRQRVQIMPDTVLGMHHSPYAFSAMLRASGIQDDEPRWKVMKVSALVNAAEVLSRGIEPSFLLGGVYYLYPECIVDFKMDPNQEYIFGLELLNRYQFWVPSREIMEQLTDKTYAGWWPNADDMPIFEGVIGGRFNYEDHVVDASVMYARFSEIGMCGNR